MKVLPVFQQSSTRPMGNFLVLLLVLFLVNPVFGGAKFSIKVQEFLNPGYLDFYGSCCDGEMVSRICKDHGLCTYTIKICFNQTDCTPKHNLESDGNETLSSSIITRNFESWGPRAMTFIIYDEDTTDSSLIDTFSLDFRHSPISRNDPWITKELIGTRKEKPARLTIKMLPVCEKNFFQENCSIKCVPQDECSGHYKCSQMGEQICIDGWTGKNCREPTGANICASNETCENGGNCSRRENVFYCCCPERYGGRQCNSPKPCKEDSCENGGNCSSSGACTCRAGFSGPFCEIEVATIPIVDILTTESSSHATTIQNHQCPENRYGPNCDCEPRHNCIQGFYTCNEKGERVCEAGWIPPQCETPVIDCNENKCRNNGSCVQGKCCCSGNFKGILCQDEIIRCEHNPCQNGAKCEDQIGSFQCLCQGGFMGNRCEFAIKNMSATQSSRNFSGVTNTKTKETITTNSISTMKTTSQKTNTCPPNRYGEWCSVFCIPEDSSLAGHWVCDSMGHKACKTGWTGQMCNTRTNTKIPCSSSISCRHGTCVNESCICYIGYEGEFCQNEILECEPKPCQNGGTCVDGIGLFTCICKPGFTGSVCNITIIEHTTMTYSTKGSKTKIITNKSTRGTREPITNLPKSTISIPKINSTSILEPVTFNTTPNDNFVSTNTQKQVVTTGSNQQNRDASTVAATDGTSTIRQSTVSKTFNPVVTFKTSQVSTDAVASHFPTTTQFTSASSTVELSDGTPTNEETTAVDVVTSKTTETQKHGVTSSTKTTKQDRIPVSMSQSTSNQKHDVTSSTKTTKQDRIPVSTPQSTSNQKHDVTSSTKTTKQDRIPVSMSQSTSNQNVISTKVSDFVTNKQSNIYETFTPTATILSTRGRTPETRTKFLTNKHITSPVSAVTPSGNGTVSSPSSSSVSLSGNVTVTGISTSTVIKKTSEHNISNTSIPTLTTKSTRAEYVTSVTTGSVAARTSRGNAVTKMVSIGTTQTSQYVRVNFTIFLRSWVPKSKEFIRRVTKLAWNRQQDINNSSNIDFHVETEGVYICLTRNGEKVTEFIFSVSYNESSPIQTKAPAVDTITWILKNHGYVYEVYTGPRPWRYEYHYTLFVKGREEQPVSVDYKDILTKAWLNTYSEFHKYVFEIAIVLTERYLLPNGLDVTKFTYFVLSNYCLVDPKVYPAPSLGSKLPVLTPSQNSSVLRYKDTNSVSITKAIYDKDNAQLERVLKKSLTETFKELNESSDLHIQILKKEKFITLDRNTVWKVIFRIVNSSSGISFPQSKLNDSWFDHLDNHLKSTKPFKTRGNRVYRKNTAIDSFYTYAIVLNGFVSYKVCNKLELDLLKVWRRNSTLNEKGNSSVRILQIIPYTGDYGSEASMVIYVVYDEDRLLNPRHEHPPSTDVLNARLLQGPFYGVYGGDKSQLISNDFLYSFTLTSVLAAFGEEGLQLRDNVSSAMISDHVSSGINQIQIVWAKPKLVVTMKNLIVSKVRYFAILNDSIPLNPSIIGGPGAASLRSAGVDVYARPIRPLLKLEVTNKYVNLRQLRQIESALVTAWTPNGSASVKIHTTAKEQLSNNTGHIHTRVWYFINLQAPLAIPDLSSIPGYLDFDANKRLYRINIIDAYKKIDKDEAIVLSLKNAWTAANKNVSTSELRPILHSWDNNYHMVKWGFVTQIYYSLTVEGIESSLTALSEPSLEDYELALQKNAKIGLCNCTALRGHFVYLFGSRTPSLIDPIEHAIAVAWRNVNFDFNGNLTAHVRTVDDGFESEHKVVFKITYIIVPILGEVIIPDEELETVNNTILIRTFHKYLPTLEVLKAIPSKRGYFEFWPIIVVCIVVGSIIILSVLVCLIYAHRKRIRSKKEKLITDPKLLKGYNREHFASEPESPTEFKNTAIMYKDYLERESKISGSYDINNTNSADLNNLSKNNSSNRSKKENLITDPKLLKGYNREHFASEPESPTEFKNTAIMYKDSLERESKISGSYDINNTNSFDLNNISKSNSSKFLFKGKHAIKLLPKDNRSISIQLESAHAKQENVNQFIKEIKDNKIATSSKKRGNFSFGCVPETRLSELADPSDTHMAVNGVIPEEVGLQNGTNENVKQKTMEKHVTINLDSIQTIESQDPNRNNENNKESFPIEVDPETTNKINIQHLGLSTEKVEIIKSSEASNPNQDNVDIENNSEFINSVDDNKESCEVAIETLKPISCKIEETPFQSKPVTVTDGTTANKNTFVNQDLKIEGKENILDGSFLNTDKTTESGDSKIAIEGENMTLADDTSMAAALVDTDLKATYETQTSNAISLDEDMGANANASNKKKQIVCGDTVISTGENVNLGKKFITRTKITEGKPFGSNITKNVREVTFENKSSALHTSTIGLASESKQLWTSKEVEHATNNQSFVTVIKVGESN